MEVKRRKLQGVLNILSFNRHFYLFGCLALALVVGSHAAYKWSDGWYAIVLLAFVYGLAMPLLVSAYVYDFSGFYRFEWLKNSAISHANGNLHVNINAGFDETSFTLQQLFPKADLRVFDFYNAQQHTEPAIVRARKVSMVFPNTQAISSGNIPLDDHSVDVIFLLSAVHEMRQQTEKVQFLRECRRVCKPNGQVIMVEHLRDFPNFVAFTIGFTHFFSKKVWKKAFDDAGFTKFHETKFTPFMSIFNCRP